MKNILNKVKKTNKKNILLISVPIVTLIIVLSLVFGMNNGNILSFIENPDGVKIKEEYEKLNGQLSNENKEYKEVKINSSNKLKYTSESELLEIIKNKEDAVVYFGYPSCLYCRTSLEILVNTSNSEDIDKILYLDTEENEVTSELLKALNIKTKEDLSSLVVFITDGEISSYHKDTIYSQTDPYKEIDESGIEGLSEIYKLGINDVIESKKLK